MQKRKLRYSFFEPDIDTQKSLVDGTVGVEGFDVHIVTAGSLDSDEADVKEQSLGSHLGPDKSFIAIPVYPNRKFRQSYITVRTNAGIESPKDLEGKRVGINHWGQPACIWARGALQNYYGVDLTQIEWLSGSPFHGSLHDAEAPNVSAFQIGSLPPATEGRDAQYNRMLIEGELDAVIYANVLSGVTNRDPRMHRLFGDDSKAEEIRYFRDTGIFPISHVVTLTKAFVEQNPDAPLALLKAHRQARDLAFYRLEGPDPSIICISWVNASIQEQRALMGEHYWAYNVESNRVPLAAYMEFLFQQGLSEEKLDYENFFVPETASFPGF